MALFCPKCKHKLRDVEVNICRCTACGASFASKDEFLEETNEQIAAQQEQKRMERVKERSLEGPPTYEDVHQIREDVHFIKNVVLAYVILSIIGALIIVFQMM